MTKYVRAIGLVALGGVVALLGQSLFSAGGDGGEGRRLEEWAGRDDVQRQQVALAEQRCRSVAEFSLIQTFRLTEFRRFARVGQDIGVVVVGSSNASVNGGTRLPSVVLDPAAREAWSRLAESLEGLEGGVDPRVFEAFRAIGDFTRDHPWPPRMELAIVSRSDWARSAVLDRWVALNRTLSSRVAAALGEFYTGT